VAKSPRSLFEVGSRIAAFGGFILTAARDGFRLIERPRGATQQAIEHSYSLTGTEITARGCLVASRSSRDGSEISQSKLAEDLLVAFSKAWRGRSSR